MSVAVVIGAGGGIGGALVARLAADPRYAAVHALSRTGGTTAAGVVRPGIADVTDPDSLAAAAADIGEPVDLLLVATGMLHDGGHGPERALRELDRDRLARAFLVNAIGPALAIQAFAPRLRTDGRATIACLSARVGSVSDNRLGGWYGYRASKAALNQIVRTAAIEIARKRPLALCVGIHPGTVDTGLSRPFQGNVPAGQLFTPAYSAERILTVLDALEPAATGRCFAWDGAEIAP